jgi:hypothetical protein
MRDSVANCQKETHSVASLEDKQVFEFPYVLAAPCRFQVLEAKRKKERFNGKHP